MLLYYLKKSGLFIVLGITIILFFVYHNQKNDGSDPELTPVSDSGEEQDTEEEAVHKNSAVVVDVKGAVKKPGIYEVSSDSRVNDVVEMAGGFIQQADQSMVNLAQKVQDEMVIAVPEKGENLDGSITADSAANKEEKINLNRAEKEKIETLPGIGPSKAQAIIDYREENGLFHSEDDLLEIPGIGEKTLENLEDHIQVP